MSDPLSYLFSLQQFGIKVGLDNIRTLVEGLGYPDRAFRSLHIAGTNGKGSATAMLDAALRAAGIRSARYTSPHLTSLAERFVIDGCPIGQAALTAAVAHVRDRVDRLLAEGVLHAQPTFFEVTTAVALELFRRANVAVAVLEVGMGGRLDATNVITPMATAITSIAFDHERYLGHTLRAIALEKAGIVKPGVPVVIGRLDAEAETAVEDVAGERGAELVRAWEGVSVDRVARVPDGRVRIRLRTPACDYGEVTMALRGTHQIANAVVAVRLLEVVGRQGLGLPPQAIVAGLEQVSWPGRLEPRRLADGRELILDAAHNPAGAAALAAYLAEAFDARLPLVFGVMGDKDASRMFEALLPHAAALVVTRASNPRSAPPETLAQLARALKPDLPVLVEPALSDALAAAWKLSPRIVVAGSIFLLGDVIKSGL